MFLPNKIPRPTGLPLLPRPVGSADLTFHDHEELATVPYLVEAADGTILQASEDSYGRAESTARMYVSSKRVETRVIQWRDSAQGVKSRELWCSSDYPASVRFAAAA